MVKVAVVGATGYAGEELLRILINHPKVKISYLAAKLEHPSSISEIFPHFRGRLDLVCSNLELNKLEKRAEVIFLALPHGISSTLVPKIINKKKIIIDLSADFRLRDASLYQRWYYFKHKNKILLEKAVYGLPEIYRKKIKEAELIANPGCYPTGAILAIFPLIKNNLVEFNDIIIDAKSGTTGAGRTLKEELLFSEVDDSMRAYKVNTHQHMPEIEQELSWLAQKKVEITFVPHLIPIKRGILTTCYLKLKRRLTGLQIIKLYKDIYKREPFVRVYNEGRFPQIRDVLFSNYCDIGIKLAARENRIIVVSAIDNLGKGASGQALQNLNIVMGWPEKLGLK